MKRSRKTGRFVKPLAITLATLLAFVVLIEWIAPPLILKSVNRQLNKKPQFQNHVGGLDINLLRGGYTLENFEIRRRWGDSSFPIFTAKSIDVSLKWAGLFRGRATGELFLREPSWQIVKQLPRNKKHKTLSQILERFYPFPIDRLEVRDGSIHYLDLGPAEKGRAPVHIYVDRFDGEARGLAAFQPEGGPARAADSAERRASAWITTRAMGRSPVRVELTLIPEARYPDLDMKASLEDFPIALMNDLFRAYARLDVESGTVGFTSRIRARGGRFQGVLYPRMRGLKILDAKEDEGVVQKTWEALAEAAGKFLESEQRIRPASERSVSGTFTQPGQDPWKALGTLWVGAFAHSLDPRLGKFIPLQEGIAWDVVETQK